MLSLLQKLHGGGAAGLPLDATSGLAAALAATGGGGGRGVVSDLWLVVLVYARVPCGQMPRCDRSYAEFPH